MFSKSITIPVGIFLCIGICAFVVPPKHDTDWTDQSSLTQVLRDLGDKMPVHFLETYSPEDVKRGEDIIKKGFTNSPEGKVSSRVSKYFLCTHCHNTVIEDPDIKISDPERRLAFAESQKIPFLPATTFYGVVNRKTFYNDDYAKKYGSLVLPARDTLVNAIQLCATECSQGRKMTDWEIKSVLAYFYSIEYKLKDLNLTPEDWEILNTAAESHASEDNTKAVNTLKSKFLQASPATFTNPYDKSGRTFGEGGNVTNGERIYKHTCQWCHKVTGGVSDFKMDDEKITFRFLKKKLKKNSKFSVYYMIRKGTYAVPGHRPYMPNFSLERLSKTQMEDLVAFILSKAK
ncbi:MAG: c-type cytochrome [Flavobacteriales bacterium]